jgi:sec-independent protein translocase protein TatA
MTPIPDATFTLAFIQNLGGQEMILIFFVVLLIFGPKKLPELFRSLGKSLKEFKKASSEIEDDIRTAMNSEPEVRRPLSTEKDPNELHLHRDS